VDRLARLRDAAAAAGLDACLLTSDESIAYLTGFRPIQMERLFAVVVAARNGGGGGAIVVPRLDEGQVDDAPGELRRLSYDAASDGLPELSQALGDGHRVGVEEDHLNFARARALQERGVDLVPATDVVMDLRARKDEQEIERIREACRLVEAALQRLFDDLRPGDVEQTVNARVEAWLREQGATAAHPVILFGENAANPHGEPGARELRAGDVVCADVSACLDGYWGDLTRCATAGPPSAWAQDVHAAVHEAQRAAIAACRPGVPARDVNAAQHTLLERHTDLGAILHGAGHAIGLAIHEPPFLVPRTETPLAPGMIFTIEPGLYDPEHGGIRLEDDVVVRDGDPEILSTLPLDLVELPA
jgi:Xaa-Pro dipeptidase